MNTFTDRLYFVILVRVPRGVMRALLWAATVENKSPHSGLARSSRVHGGVNR